MTDRQHNTALLVLGMHRSGTSAITGMLSIAGADPGGSLLPAMQGVNPKGFWEHTKIVAIHERLLATLHSSWADERFMPVDWWHLPVIADYRKALAETLRREFSASPLWIVKDPRLCRLLPLWLDILAEIGAEPRFVLCLRHPYEVALSLEQRDGISLDRSCLLWLVHLLDSVRWTRGHPRIVVTYDHLLTDWRTCLRHIADGLSVPLQTGPAVAEKIDSFLEPALRHHQMKQATTQYENRICQLAADAYALMEHNDIDPLLERLTTIAAETEREVRKVTPWATELCALTNRNTELLSRVMELSAANTACLEEIARIKNSPSWRLTSPLRILTAWGRKSD